MCIICSSEIGKGLPTDNTIEIMWNGNSDGAGFMYNSNGEVVISKGYMTLSAFKTALNLLKKQIDVVNTAIVLHFRIGTQGGNIPENTHPFPITDKEPLLKKLNHKCSIGMAHNGIITCVQPRTDISDTMEYVEEVLSYLRYSDKYFYQNKGIQKLIENTINGSRMCFLNGKGEITYIGNWVEDKTTGLMYSNKNYLYDPFCYGYYRSKKKNKVYKGNYESEKYGDYFDSSPYEIDFDAYEYEEECLIESKLMMLLNDSYVISDGDFIDSNEVALFIDEASRVYRYSDELGLAILIEGATAYNSNSEFVRFDEDNEDIDYIECTTEEYEEELMDEYYGEVGEVSDSPVITLTSDVKTEKDNK